MNEDKKSTLSDLKENRSKLCIQHYLVKKL